MEISFDKNIRRIQREILVNKYPDYDSKYHDVYVQRWNKEQDKQFMKNYLLERGLECIK